MSERQRGRREAPRDTSESVRIIGPDEAAQVSDRGEAQRRMASGEARHGDRPPTPSGERPVPALRFPLDSSADLERFELPPAAPAGRPEDPGLAHWAESGPEEVPHMSPHDPYQGDEAGEDAAGWSAFGGAGPRWRDDEPGMPGQPPPPPGGGAHRRPSQQGEPIAFEDDDYAEPAAGRSVFDDSQESSVHDVAYEDDYRDQGYGDAGGRRQEYVTRSAFTTPYDESYTQPYDDSYTDDVYTEPQPAPPAAPARPRASAARPRTAQRRSTGSPTADRDMPKALAVAGGLIVAALVLAQIGPPALLLLVTVLMGVASLEYFTATQRAGFDPLMPVGVVATVGLVLTAYSYGERALPLVLVLTIGVCLVWYLLGAGGERPMANVGATLVGVGWVGLLGAYAGLLLGAANGVALFMAAVIPAVGYDLGGWFVGRSAGSRPLSEASPNKTVEGLVGGMVLALVAGLLVGMLFRHPFSFFDGFKIGLVAALVAPLGDLSQSLLKRDLGVKDMGTILPGHGGILDRFDSLLFVLPAIWYLTVVSDGFGAATLYLNG